VFVWVDPELQTGTSDNIIGECSEQAENDNISAKTLDITHILLEQGKSASASSMDKVFYLETPVGTVSKNEAIFIEPVANLQASLNQPDISFITLPEIGINAYSISNALSSAMTAPMADSQAIEMGKITFAAPAWAQMRFDISALSDDIRTEIGLGDVPEDSMEPDQRETLKQILKERISSMAVYAWNENAKKWVYNTSEPVLDDNANILQKTHNTAPLSQNIGDGSIERGDIQVNSEITPVGEWVVFFVDTNVYELYFRSPGDLSLKKLSDKIGRTGSFYQDDSLGGAGTELQFTIHKGNVDFRFGDVIRFNTVETINQDGIRLVTLGTIDRRNSGDGTISTFVLDDNADTLLDEWVILFINSQQYYIQGLESGIISQNDAPLIGTVDKEYHDPGTGFKFNIKAGLKPFKIGDKFKFRTSSVGSVKSAIKTSGIFSLVYNTDNRPPEIHLDVGEQNFADGDVVASEPAIHILLSDNNGVDIVTRNPDISISKDGKDFEPASVDDYSIHWDMGSNDVPVNYWPGKLEPGEYEVKVEAFDFNGNSNQKSIRFMVKREFELAKDTLMNYPNPFERETDITFQLTSVAEEAVVKIYTVSGRLIRTLEKQHAINFVVIHWDGKDKDGKEVANGVYYYKVRLKQEGRKDIVEIGKMLKLK